MRNLFRHCLKTNSLTEDFIFDWMSLRTPSPFVPTTSDGSPQEQKLKPLQKNINQAFDELKLKDVKSPEIIVEENAQSPEAERGEDVGDSFGKAESSLSSVSVLCSPCLSVTHQVQSSSAFVFY